MKNKGISLIVLIITIVVIIILATAIIVNLAQTNIIRNANSAVLKQDFKTFQDELNLYVIDKFVDSNINTNTEKFNAQTLYADETTIPSVYEILPSLRNSKYDGYVYILNGKIAISDEIPEEQRNSISEVISFEKYTASNLDSNKKYTLQADKSMLLPGGATYEIIESNTNISLNGRKVIVSKAATSSDDAIIKGTIDGNTYTIEIYVIPEIDNNEFVVKTEEDFARVAFLINNKILETQNIRLESDINLSNVCNVTLGSWTPIGNASVPYTGIFDGNSHSVSGLYISNSLMYQGLFGYVTNGASIKNTQISGVIIANNDCIGGIAGYLEGSTIENCISKVQISTSAYDAGGIVGLSVDSTINKCVNDGPIFITNNEARWNIGGIAGTLTESNVYLSCNVNNISSTGNGKNRNVGGIAGHVDRGDSTIINCYNTGSLSADNNIGGIVGLVNGYSGTTSVTITNTYNTGSINGNGNIGATLGLKAEENYASSINISNSYALDTCKGSASYNAVLKNSSEMMNLASILGSEFINVNNAYPILKWQQE